MKLMRLQCGCRVLNSWRSRALARRLAGLLPLAVSLVFVRPVGAQDQALSEIRTATEVRALSAAEAGRHHPVHLRGVLTFFDQSRFYRFIQDETAGVYFFLEDRPDNPRLVPGQLLEIRGVTSKGEFAPIVDVQQVGVLGEGQFPAAKPVSFEQLASGQEDSQFVQVQGIVRWTFIEERDGYANLEIATGGGRLTALAPNLPPVRAQGLADSVVTVNGVCVTRFNRQRQLFDIRLLVPRPADLVVQSPAPPSPFDLPASQIGSLLQFTPQGPYGHRVKVAGTVIYRVDDATLYIQDEAEGLHVETKQAGRLQVGDRVEVLGFPARGDYTPMLQDAIFRQISSGPPPEPDPVTADEALKGTHDCRLVRLQATLLDRARHSREQFLVLQAGGFVFHAYLEGTNASAELGTLRNDSLLAVTGICLVETGSEWHVGDDWRASSFRLLLRSAADIRVLKSSPWWTLRRLLWTVGLLAVVVLGAFVWVGVLRRRVQQQTEIIRERLRAEAAMKERYVDLFENANDMVYTHDLQGRLTSINQAGETLLQLRRNQVLSRNIVELIAPEQQAAARQWLEQVLQGTAPPTTEWDFVVSSGQRLKLEISTRLIEQHGERVEVEGIARDITERKRLERELLEVSNREQRRIGHDLHDGVCQQLVGIAYLTETLADRLQEKGAGDAAAAERISNLLNAAINQTRGVARGLFPVRLEEDGLVLALEELAANASQLFQLACRFTCRAPPAMVDNAIALHLYYIAQEAVANAAKHGKARTVLLQLEPAKDGYALTIQDDGAGFAPSRNQQSGMGLQIMQYRARVIGATLEIKSQPGAGTRVVCCFSPVPAGAPR